VLNSLNDIGQGLESVHSLPRIWVHTFSQMALFTREPRGTIRTQWDLPRVLWTWGSWRANPLGTTPLLSDEKSNDQQGAFQSIPHWYNLQTVCKRAPFFFFSFLFFPCGAEAWTQALYTLCNWALPQQDSIFNMVYRGLLSITPLATSL
jgi:hypothetical protein